MSIDPALLPEPLEESIPREIFKAEVDAWAKRIGVEYKELHIREMTRKWASCSSRGRLTFDKELLTKHTSFRANVIVHELVHLAIPNHGKLFQQIVNSHLHTEYRDRQ